MSVVKLNQVELSNITVNNGASDGKNLVSRQSGNAPGIFAVRLTSSASVKNHWVFSFLSKYNFKFDINSRNIDSRPPGIGNQTRDYFAGESIYSQKLDETWGGITYGRNITSKIAFGITQFISYRYQKGRVQSMGQFYPQSGDASSLVFFKEFKYTHIRAITKLGFAFALEPLSFGFTLTGPGLGIVGGGETLYNLSTTNLDTSGVGSGTSILASDFQQDLSASYNSPLSVALGATYRLSKSSLYFTMEWFNSIPQFSVMKPQPFIAQSSGRIIETPYNHELKSVINFGLGFQHELSRKTSLYFSVIQDRSARISDSETLFAVSNWDIKHITLGSSLTFWRMDLTLGLTYSFGSEDFIQPVQVEGLGDLNFNDQFNPTRVDYRRIKIIIGFSILSDTDKK